MKRVNKEFFVCLAFKTNGKWKVKTLGGLSGDLCDEKLFERVIEDGIDFDESEACKIFSNAGSLKLEYSLEEK